MGKTETFFFGFLALAALVAVMLVIMGGGDTRGTIVAGGPDDTLKARPGSEMMQFTGVEREDLCTCYEQAYAYGRANGETQSVYYRGGFATCSTRMGAAGAQHWTDGWSNGARRTGPSACRAYRPESSS